MRTLPVVLLTLTLAAGAARADFSGDLLAAYFFNGNGDDSSGKGQDCQLVGATFTADRRGGTDGAASFDGTGAFITTPVSGKRFPLSYSFWFRLDDRPGVRPFSIVDSGIGNAFGHSYVIGSGSDHLNAHLASTFAFQKGVWTHVAVTYGPQLKVYMNGELTAQKDHAEDEDFVAGNIQIGRHLGSDNGRYFQGAVDDVLIYGRTLSDEEVRLLYQASAAVEQHVRLAAEAKSRLASALEALAGSTEGAETAGAAPSPVVVAVSSGEQPNTNGWSAIDADTNTVWEGAAEQPGWWLAIEYAPPLKLKKLDVLYGDGSATNLAAFYSQDANDWPELQPALEQGPIEARFLLLTFPAGEAGVVPRVRELQWE